jgi:hypothetical protein
VISRVLLGHISALAFIASYDPNFVEGLITMASSRDFSESQERKEAQFDDQKINVGQGSETHQTAEGTIPTLTTQQGMPVADDQNSLSVGQRGPSALEDSHLHQLGLFLQ